MYFFFALLVIFHFVSNYFTGEGVNDSVAFHLKYGLSGAGFGEYSWLIALAAVSVFVAFDLCLLFIIIPQKNIITIKLRNQTVLSYVFLLLSFLVHPTTLYLMQQAFKHNANKETKVSSLVVPFLKPQIKEKTKHHPNIIFIFAESLERTYMNEDLFPGLLKNLKEIEKNSISFENIFQLFGSEWTIAGITSSLCGVPLVTTSGGNSMGGTKKFYPRAYCLTDYLKQMEYELSHYQGGALEFAGTREFFETHSVEELHGKKQLSKVYNQDNHQSEWGVYDNFLFDYTLKEVEAKYDSGKKFGVIISTVDTHHPSGHKSEYCEARGISYKSGNNEILNAVACADILISEFIGKIKKLKNYEETVFIIASDHLAMNNDAINILKKTTRKNLLIIHRPHKKNVSLIKKKGGQMDIATTLLWELGFEGNIGLGVNLFGEEKSYLEKNKTIENTNSFLERLRPSFEKLWGFPERILKLSYINNEIVIEGRHFKLPVVFKLNDDDSFTPFFRDGILKENLKDFIVGWERNQRFLWFDKCSKMSFFVKNSLNAEEGFCYLNGQLGGKLKLMTLADGQEYSIDIKEAVRSNYKDLSSKEMPLNNSPKIIDEINHLFKNIPSGSNVYFPSASLNPDELKKVCQCNIFSKLPLKREFYTLEKYFPAKKLSHLYAKTVYHSNKPFFAELYDYITNILKEKKIKLTYNENRVVKYSPRGMSFLGEREEGLKKSKDRMRFIAHAGGEIEGNIYTNSLEALNINYKKGFRSFELDILKTKDGSYVAAHDWKTWQKHVDYKGKLPPTHSEFIKYKYDKRYTPLDMRRINDWFGLNKDAILVTDKIDEPLLFSKSFKFTNRLMMELFSLKSLKDGLRAGIMGAMPNWSVIENVSGDKIAFLKAHKIEHIAASRRELERNLDLLIQLKLSGIKVFVYHVNFDNEKDEKFVACYEMDYIYGMYVDKWDFKGDLRCE